MDVFMGHSRSSTLSPFDRAHTTSYSPLDTLYVYLVPFTQYTELFVERCKFYLSHVHFAPPLEVAPFEFPGDQKN